MTPIHLAFKKLMSNPKENWTKILPYIKSISEPKIRKALEFLQIESRSKPYPGHNQLSKHVNFKDGFFVVCGGNDGYGFDPTYYLEKFRDWTGVIIEPLPKAAKLCRMNRSNSIVYELALVSYEFKDKCIDIYDCNFMSVTQETQYNINDWVKSGEKVQNIMSQKISVPAATLDSVIEQSNVKVSIDLLVIDVEGSEMEVLNGFNLKLYKPKFILVELHNEKLKKAVESILGELYTFVEKVDYADYLFKLK